MEMAPLTLTAKALEKIREVIAAHGVKMGTGEGEMGLRVGIRGGGCGVSDYLLGFDQKKGDDNEYWVEGLLVLMDKRHSLHVMGMEVDWFEDENQKGFVFNNPAMRK